MFRTLTSRQLAFDVVTAALYLGLRFAIGMYELPMFPVVIAMAAALGLRRVSPPLALAVAWAGAITQVTTGLNPDVSNLAILPVLYATASYGGRRLKWLGLASGGAGAVVITAYLTLRDVWFSLQCSGTLDVPCFNSQNPHWGFVLVVIFFSALAVFVLSWTFGLLAKTWRTARESANARALAERQRIDAQRETAVEQERNRIARDMHDVVAHSLAVVIAQADGARYVREHDPEVVDVALTTIASTAREALGDVRVLLAQLRHSQGESPQPTLADLERLYEQLKASGLRLVVDSEGHPSALAVGQQLAVYRIVQEALTNALRHGDAGAEVRVRFVWSAERVELTVANEIAVHDVVEQKTAVQKTVVNMAAGHEAAGHGLAGMRERAALWGGTLVAGAQGHGYVVTATLPIPAPAMPAPATPTTAIPGPATPGRTADGS